MGEVGMNRRNFLKGIAASSACCAIGVARFVEPNWIEVTRSQIQLGRTQGVTKRIVHLSDFHYSGSVSLDRIRWAIDLALEAAPQVVCITGDFIDRRMPREPPYLEALERLTRYVPTLGVVGNHDGGRWASQVGGYQDANPVYDLARSAGIRMLENEYLPELKGGDLVQGNSLTTPIFHNRNSISTPKDLLLTSAPTKLGLGCKKPTPPSYFFGA